jgi:hypothetical protein
VQLRATASVAGFTGTCPDVRVFREDFDRFVQDAIAVAEHRAREAKLDAMTPQDLSLRVAVADAAGHLIASGWVGQISYAGRRSLCSRIELSIDVEPATLLRELRRL